MSARIPAGPALLVAAFFLLAGTGAAQTTRAERTDFRETSSYADVLAFLDSLQQVVPDIRVGALATTVEGRRVPFVVTAHRSPARPKPTEPAS